MIHEDWTFIHDVIKIEFINIGYLPNYPYHLISDREMFDAFIHVKMIPDPEHPGEYIPEMDPDYPTHPVYEGFFPDYYARPEVVESKEINLVEPYYALIDDIMKRIEIFFYKDLYPGDDPDTPEYKEIQKKIDQWEKIPSWVYSYMLLRTITYQSDQADLYYLYSMLHDDGYFDQMNYENTSGEYIFSPEMAQACYLASSDWKRRNPSSFRKTRNVPTMFGEPHVTKSLRLDQVSLYLDERYTG